MMRFNSTRLLAGAVALLAAGACKDLDVTNPNNPDITRALASPQDVKNLAISTVNSWYLSSTYLEPYMMLQVTADASTANFGNFGMRFNNLEPRIAYENSSAGGDRAVTESPWNGNYATLGAANDALRAIANGVVINTPAETNKYKVLGLWAQAGSLANLGLLFDKAFITDETFIPGESAPPELKGYKDVVAAAMTKWDALITQTNTGNETYTATDIPITSGVLTTERLNRIANSMAAWTLVMAARNGTENTATPWARVLGYAEKGLSGPQGRGQPFDFVVSGDNNNWYSYINYYGNEVSWVKVDMRLICRMDPSKACKYNGTNPGAITNPAADRRATSDYAFTSVIGDPARGIYMQSPFHHSRYAAHARTSATAARTPAPYMLMAENDLLIAEALVRTNGSLQRAADLINRTRVTRGGLAAVSGGDGAAALLTAIDYERDVELLNTNGQQLYDARRFMRLQTGAVRHLPIPAKELETLQLPIYTFGGGNNPDMVIIAPDGEELPLRRPISRPMRASLAWMKADM